MKHIITFIATLMAVLTPCLAQPSGVKEAANSVFKLTTYKADGTVLAESNGVFTSADGTAVSSLKPFLGAARAVVTDVRSTRARYRLSPKEALPVVVCAHSDVAAQAEIDRQMGIDDNVVRRMIVKK